MSSTNGGEQLSFRKLMALKEVGKDVFESLTPAWPPASLPSVGKRAFGGHVYAQAAWAASRTVANGYYVHNVTGHFLLAGMTDVPFTYHVRRVRDGGIYCLRSVEVFQASRVAAEGRTPCFVSTISFKREEDHDGLVEYAHQNASRDHIKKVYATVLHGKNIEDHPLAPRADASWGRFLEGPWDPFPGCEMRKVDMEAFHGKAEPGGGPDGNIVSKWRQLLFYRIFKDAERVPDEDDLNLHLAAHLYASDRNGLFLVLRALGYDETLALLGSLAHTVIFHGDPEAMRMIDIDGNPRWFVQEAWTSNSGENRVCHNSRLWNHEKGLIIATTMQDGMMRLLAGSEQLSRL